jgi:hypothetical protein
VSYETTLDERLAPLPARVRTGFAAAAAERVFDIYATVAATDHFSNAVHDAIDLAWRFAGGAAIADDEVARARAALDDALEPFREDGGKGYYAIMPARFAIDSIPSHSIRDVQYAARYALDAVDGTDDGGGDALAEEQAWQLRALDALAAFGERPIPRDGLRALFLDEPAWLVRWMRSP